MHVTHVISSVAAEAAGPSYSVTRLGQSLAARGVNVNLMSAGDAGEGHNGHLRTRVLQVDFARAPVLRRLSFSRALRAAVDREAAGGAILHGHGLWLMPNLYPGWSAAQHGTPLVVSPRGMLSAAAMQFSRWKKRAFWALAQRRALRAAKCLHATSRQECEEIRAFGLCTAVAIIPNGIDVPPADAPKQALRGDVRSVLTLGRVHPKKGVDRLIHAWARVEAAHPDWRLRIVGPSESGHGEALRALVSSLGLLRVEFEGPLYGDAKTAAYRDADLFVLPTLNENFGLVVAEALAHRTPVISTKGAPWHGLVENGCGWWVDNGVEPLAATLTEAMAMPQKALAGLGERGRAWMLRDFSWEKVAMDMMEVYRWCAGEGDRPEHLVREMNERQT